MGAAGEDAVALEKVRAVFKTEKGKGWDEWEVLEMDVREHIGQPTHGQLVIAATSQGFDFSPMLGKSCVLVLSRGDDRRRYFKGLVFRIEHRGEYSFGSVARVDFATAVWAMRHGQDSRVFEKRTAPQILEEVFKEALAPFGRRVRSNLSRKYAVREYCVQYNESDWNFVQRLMVDEGISFYLDEGGKEADRETVVLVDSNGAFPEIETMGSSSEPEAELGEETALNTWATAGQSAADAPQFVEIQMKVDGDENAPGLDLPFTVRLPDGTTREERLDKEGLARISIARNRECQVTFKHLDYSEWKPANGARDGRQEPSGQGTAKHIVKQGECLASIAHDYGFSWRALWDAPENQGLREMRRNPGILYPGDKVFVSERKLRWETCAPGTRNSFVRRNNMELLRLILTDAEGEPQAGLSYAVMIDDGEFAATGVTTNDGLVECEIRVNARRGTMLVGNEGEETCFELMLGFLDPIREISGVQARLNALGYLRSAPNGTLDPLTREALWRFQKDHSLNRTGELDDETKQALKTAHGL